MIIIKFTKTVLNDSRAKMKW